MTPYRMPSILDVFLKERIGPSQANDHLEMLAQGARRSLAKFVVNVDGDPNRFQVIGTGFWAAINKKPFLITAHHVVDDFNMAKGGGIVAGDLGWKICRGTMIFDPVKDVAAIVPQSVIGKDESDLPKLPVLYPFCTSESVRWHPTTTLLTIGFPASKNIHDRRKPRSSIGNYFQYFCHRFELNEAADEIQCDFDSEKCFTLNNCESAFKTLPAPQGLSGSPAMIVMYGESAVSITLALRVVGVAIAWRPDQKKLVVRRIGDSLI